MQEEAEMSQKVTNSKSSTHELVQDEAEVSHSAEPEILTDPGISAESFIATGQDILADLGILLESIIQAADQEVSTAQ